MAVATLRRLEDELNTRAELEFVYKFRYQADFGDLGAEHELCHVYLGRIEGLPSANDQEIEALRFVAPEALDREFEASPATLTPWFKLEWRALRDEHAATLAAYTGGA